jgi:hypothetical protein
MGMTTAALIEIRRVTLLVNAPSSSIYNGIEIGATLLRIVPSGTADASK